MKSEAEIRALLTKALEGQHQIEIQLNAQYAYIQALKLVLGELPEPNAADGVTLDQALEMVTEAEHAPSEQE